MTLPLKKSIYSQTQKELEEFFITQDLSRFLAPALYEHLYRKKAKQALKDSTWALLKETYSFYLPSIIETQKAQDGTVKFLLQLEDGKRVETVLIPFHKRYSVCLSSQVGCAMKCSFCYTGTKGLTRNLMSHEIVGQFLVAQAHLYLEIDANAVTPSVVLMGQGEPLHNFDEVKKALTILTQREGPGLGPSQITLSTAGLLPGLKKFNLLPPVNLALSLHSPFNDIRKKIIPLGAQYSIEDIMSAIDEVRLKKGQFIVYEYILINGLNDRPEDADELARLLQKRRAIVNLIPFNPFPGCSHERPSDERVSGFKNLLVERRIRTMVRTTKGPDILAACGQLNT